MTTRTANRVRQDVIVGPPRQSSQLLIQQRYGTAAKIVITRYHFHAA